MNREKMPEWLERYEYGDEPVLRDFLRSRNVLSLQFNRADSPYRFVKMGIVHCVIIVSDQISANINVPDGYVLYDTQSYTKKDMMSFAVGKSYLEPEEVSSRCQVRSRCQAHSFARLHILEKMGDNGLMSDRLAVLQVRDDPLAFYDQFFCNGNALPPIVMIAASTYGFTDGVDEYVRGGVCERLAKRADIWPDYILTNREPWTGYLPEESGDESNHFGEGLRLYRRDLANC